MNKITPPLRYSEIRVTIKLHPQAMRAVNLLLESGLYGLTKEEVVERLAERQLEGMFGERLKTLINRGG